MTFGAWMTRIDEIMIAHIGLGHDDIADQNYYDMFDDGLSPLDAVCEAVANEFGSAALSTFGLEEF